MFYYFDGWIFPVEKTSIMSSEECRERNPLILVGGGDDVMARKMTTEQFHRISDRIVNALLSNSVIIDIGKMINEEFGDQKYHEAPHSS